MPRTRLVRFSNSFKIEFLSKHYRWLGRLQFGPNSLNQILEIEDMALQHWNLNRSTHNLNLLYSNPYSDMLKSEVQFWDLPNCLPGKESQQLMFLRIALMKMLRLNHGILGDYAKYIEHCQKHVARDLAEAISDASSVSGDKNEFIKAQIQWSGAIRKFEVYNMEIDVQLCRKCRNVMLHKAGYVNSLCSSCNNSSNSDRRTNHQSDSDSQEDDFNMFSSENMALPPPPLPGAALLSDDERAIISPLLPYIRVTQQTISSRGQAYGHTFIAPQQISAIVKCLPRLPSEVHYAVVCDSESNLRWDVNVIKVVRFIQVMASDHILSSVFAAHGVQLSGADCNARVQEWDQTTVTVPRITFLHGNNDPLQEFCSAEHENVDTEDDLPEENFSQQYEGPDLSNQDDSSEPLRPRYSMVSSDITINNTYEGISLVLDQLEGQNSDTVTMCSNIRQIRSVTDKHPDLFNLCFPYLNFGSSDFFFSLQGRPKQFHSRSQWLRHIIMSHCRFSSDKLFAFVAQNWVQRDQVFNTAAVFMKKNSETSQKSLSEIKEEMEQGDFSSLNDIVSFSRSIQGSVPYWKEVRDKVREFCDWKCLTDNDIHQRNLNQNISGFPDMIMDSDVEIDLTPDEILLIDSSTSRLMVACAASSERAWSSTHDHHDENTSIALTVFKDSFQVAVQKLLQFFSLDAWSLHTFKNALRYHIFDQSICLEDRARWAVTLCRVQFLSMYCEVDTILCQSLLQLWENEVLNSNDCDELEMFLCTPPIIEYDMDTAIGSYFSHAVNFAAIFRERTHQMPAASNPAFFLTGSMAEYHWPELWNVMKKYVDLNHDNSDPWLESVRQNGFELTSDKAEALKRFPHISTALFKLRTELLYDLVLGPVLGIDEKIIRYEFADGRGEIHFHSLNWSSKWPIGVMVNEGEINQILNFSRAWLRLSAQHPSSDICKHRYHPHGNPNGDRASYAGHNHPSKQLFSLLDVSEVLTWDIRMCNVNFCHSCIKNGYCLRPIKGRNLDCYVGPGEPGDRCHKCRFEFHINDWRGKDELFYTEAHIKIRDCDSIPELVMERNSRFLIQHSKFFRRAWKANCDFTVIVDSDLSRIQGYIVSYMCKEGVATAEYKSFFKNLVFNEDVPDTASLVKRIMLRILGHRDRSAQEVLYTVTGNELYSMSAQRGSIINLGEMRRAVSKTSFLGSNVVDRYIREKAGDRGVSLYEFAQSEKDGYVSFSGSRAHCIWPLSEWYCRTTLLLHYPWSQALDVLRLDGSTVSTFGTYRSKFLNNFLFTHMCPRVVFAQVMFAKMLHERPELRPRNHFTLKESGRGTLATFLKSFGLRSIDADLQHAFDEDLKFPRPPPGYDWSDMSHWGELCTTDISNAISVAQYTSACSTEHTKLADLDPLGARICSNAEQRTLLSIILSHCVQRRHSAASSQTLKVVMHGAAGTGKSHVIKLLAAAVRCLTGDVESVQIVTPTGAAASQVSGETIHRGLGININGKFNTGSKQQELVQLFSCTKVLIIDEMSMLDLNMLSLVQSRIQNLMSGASDDGWQSLWCVVLSGDFMQLPPVKGTPLYTSLPCNDDLQRQGQVIFSRFDTCIMLRRCERIQDSSNELHNILNNIREGIELEQTLSAINQRCITQLPFDQQVVFQSPSVTRFVAYNSDRIEINLRHLEHATGPVIRIHSIDTGSKKHTKGYDSAVHFHGLQHLLWIGKGVRVTLCLNVCTRLKLSKGTTGTVEAVYYSPGKGPPQPPCLVLVTMDTPVVAELANKVSPLPHHRDILPFVPTNRACEYGCCFRSQLPFELAAAFTVHKSQGATIKDFTIVDLPSRAEAQWPGILYTAFSRFTALDKLAIPQPISMDALKQNRRNLYISGRKSAVDRIMRLEQKTVRKYARATEMNFYVNLLTDLLRLEQERQEMGNN